MNKHTLTVICIFIFMHLAFCNIYSGEGALIIMTPFKSEIEKAYILSFNYNDSHLVIVSEEISANIKKNEINIVCKNNKVSIYDPNSNNSRPVLYKEKERVMIFSKNSKIIIDGRLMPVEKISAYLSDPEKFNKEQSDLLRQSGTLTMENVDCIHVAREGETLDSIAAMYGLCVDDLKNANIKITDMKSGIEVTIPGNIKKRSGEGRTTENNKLDK